MKLVLIGYRCCGKSSVGRKLAKKLGWDFADTDAMVEQAAGRSVAEIFRKDGERAFRTMERKEIAKLAAAKNCVIAVGGGAFGSKSNVAALKRNAKVVWLETSLDELVRRAKADKAKRPRLTKLGLAAEIKTVLAKRASQYKAVADCIMSTDGFTVDELVARITDYLELLGMKKA